MPHQVAFLLDLRHRHRDAAERQRAQVTRLSAAARVERRAIQRHAAGFGIHGDDCRVELAKVAIGLIEKIGHGNLESIDDRSNQNRRTIASRISLRIQLPANKNALIPPGDESAAPAVPPRLDRSSGSGITNGIGIRPITSNPKPSTWNRIHSPAPTRLRTLTGAPGDAYWATGAVRAAAPEGFSARPAHPACTLPDSLKRGQYRLLVSINALWKEFSTSRDCS